MKRFLADAALILILVSIGSYIKHMDSDQSGITLQQKVDSFEEEIAQQHPIKKQVEASGLYEIKENKASQLAKTSSEFVIHGIKSSVSVVSDIFNSIFE